MASVDGLPLQEYGSSEHLHLIGDGTVVIDAASEHQHETETAVVAVTSTVPEHLEHTAESVDMRSA